MKFLANTKLIINLSIILTTLSVLYFLVVVTNLQKREADTKDEDRAKFELCLSDAMSDYLREWNSQCAQIKQAKCDTLPGLIAMRITNEWKENKLTCAKLYKN